MTDTEERIPMTNDEIMETAQELVNRYTPETIPPCRICGERLSMQAAGRGPTIYACSGDYEDETGRRKYRAGRSVADEHYSNSRWEQYRHGDRLVMKLVGQLLADRGLTMPQVQADRAW
ncbi:hypothetical protein [Rhizobium sp. MHM7A]|uniref:hypothetical protein n=1 Tax=Rhizobium sp. MHM7A TaxID=2583233 RepID=UPI001105BDD6|nr:hypothetical protein [Rhizobium sp. MHM7A]TLX16744.1 hypothetical protein FFR93_05215 [Rhizobium sp. MHM7A]